MEWFDILRILAVAGMTWGAWDVWLKMPPAIALGGKRFYRHPDGTFRTLWGRRARDENLLAQLEAAHQARCTEMGRDP